MKNTEQNKNKTIENTNTIHIGAISLGSNVLSMDELIVKLKGILKDKEIKEYLQSITLQSTEEDNNNYMG